MFEYLIIVAFLSFWFLAIWTFCSCCMRQVNESIPCFSDFIRGGGYHTLLERRTVNNEYACSPCGNMCSGPCMMVDGIVACTAATICFQTNARAAGRGQPRYGSVDIPSVSQLPLFSSCMNCCCSNCIPILEPSAPPMPQDQEQGQPGQYHPNRPNIPDNDISNAPVAPRQYRDGISAFLFIANVVYMCFLAWEGFEQAFETDDDYSYGIQFLTELTNTSLVIGTTCVLASIGILTCADLGILNALMWTAMLSSAGLSFVLFANGLPVPALCTAVFVMVSFFSWASIKDSIALPSALVSTACQGLRDCFYGSLFIIAFSICTQIVWLYISSLALYYSASQYCWQVTCLVALASAWGCHTIVCLAQASIASTVASWWFQPNRVNIAGSSFMRMGSTSLGSLCLAGLFAFNQYISTAAFFVSLLLNCGTQFLGINCVQVVQAWGEACCGAYGSTLGLTYVAGETTWP